MTDFSMRFPPDREIADYDLDRLRAGIGRMYENIIRFQQAIAQEQAQIAMYEAIIQRKLEMNAARNDGRVVEEGRDGSTE